MTFFPRFARRSRPRRFISITFGLLVVLVVLLELAGWPFLRAPLAQQLSKRTGTPVTLGGDFRLQLLLQPGLTVDDVTIGSAAEMKVPHLLEAKGFVAQWRWSDVWRASKGATLRLKYLGADQIDAHLVRLANGSANWALARSDAKAENKASSPPQIDTLVLHTGTVTYRDAPLSIDLQAHITQSAQPGARLPWHATAKGSYRGTAVNITAQAGADLPIWMEANGESKLTDLQFGGRLGTTQFDFNGEAGALWAGQGLNGKIDVRGSSLRSSGQPLGVTLPDTPPYRLRGRIAREGSVWSLVTNDATVGSSALTADMQYDTATTPPTLTGKLGGKRLAFADLAPSIGADQAPRAADRVLPTEPFNVPSLAQMNANVQVNLAQLDFGTPNISPMSDLQVHLTLENSHLALSDLSARVAGGRLTGSTSLQADQNPPHWEAALGFTDVDLKRWIPSLKKGGASSQSNAPPYLGGTLNAKVSLTGKGNSVADILGSSNGRLNLDLANGEMSQLITEAIGLDVAQALGMLIAGDVPLRLNCARAAAVVQDGVVKTHYAVLDNKDSTVRIQGGLSLKNESLQLRVVAEPKDFSPLSLRSPLNVTGSFKQPKVSIEGRNLLARAAGALVLGALAPPAALLAFIDTGAEPDSQPCTTTTPTKASEPTKP